MTITREETSYNRHISYCRRAHSRRTRVKSCRACSLAKAKCSFQPQCLRCANKGLECVYDTATTIAGRDRVADGQPSQNNPLAFSPASSTAGDFTLNDLLASSSATDTDEVRVDMDWDALGFAAADMVPQAPKSNLPRFHEPAPKVMTNGEFFLDNPDGRHVIDAFHASFDSEKLSPTRIPWSAWTTRYDYLPALFGPACLLERPDSEFLARLPILDPVSQFTATLVMQMLRAFPQMMLRRETLPSFIHGHWYRPSGVTELSLPEPLVNCMGIAQIFASQNLESKPFLWRTVQMEQRSFLEKVRSLIPFL